MHKIPLSIIFYINECERNDSVEKFIFLGGDKRMTYAAEVLSRKYQCSFGGSDIYDYAVLPLQKSSDGITIPDTDVEYSALGKLIKPGGIVFTGNICTELERVCYGYGLVLKNYLQREEMAIENAVATAEGALEIAINRLPVTIYGTTALVTGYGRIAKILADYLRAMGATVIVCCRKKSDLKWAEIHGCKAVDITDSTAFCSACEGSRVIFNTVPAPVFSKTVIGSIKRNTLYIELASADGIEAGEKNIEVVIARGLPGKTAPVTAGQIIARTIENIIAERSDRFET